MACFRTRTGGTFAKLLAPLAARIFTVPVASERTANAQELAEACRAANPTAEIIACANSWPKRWTNQPASDFIVITGSLYLVGEALELLGLSPAAASERGLNEWTGASPDRSFADKFRTKLIRSSAYTCPHASIDAVTTTSLID